MLKKIIIKMFMIDNFWSLRKKQYLILKENMQYY